MSKCKHEPCTNEARPASMYCSKSCRAQHSRRNKGATSEAQQSGATVAKPKGMTQGMTNKGMTTEGRMEWGPASDMPVITVDVNLGKAEDAPRSTNSGPAIAEQPTGIDHYYSNPDMYITRLEPERMNWGKPMSMAELASAKLKANRVPIPGDHDYDGVAQDMQGSATSHDQEARVT